MTRKAISKTALEEAITSAVKEKGPEYGAFAGVIIERARLGAASNTNWALKAVKFGGADWAKCSAVVTAIAEQYQSEYTVTEW